MAQGAMSELGFTVSDPYPYPLEDSKNYLALMMKVATHDVYLYGILSWFRATGIILVSSPKWGYVIKPLIKGTQGCQWGWSSMAEWEQEKQYLKPYQKELIVFLKEVADEQRI